MKKGHNLSHTEKAGRDMHIIAILIALGTGLFVGSRFEGAHDARQRFSSNRVRTTASLGAWLKRTIVVGISVVALILLPRRPGMTSLTRCTAATGTCNWSCRAVPRVAPHCHVGWHRSRKSLVLPGMAHSGLSQAQAAAGQAAAFIRTDGRSELSCDAFRSSGCRT